MNYLRWRVVAVVLGAAWLNSGCGFACTLIGCINGITATLTGKIPATFTAAATGSDGTTAESFTCAGGCTYIAFPNFSPPEATITITWDGGSKTVTVRPTYDVSYPNGISCGPQCHTGAVTINL